MRNKWIIAIPLILILLALCVAIVGVVFFSFRQVRAAGISVPFNRSMDYQAQSIETETYAVRGPAELRVDNAVGAVTVQAGPDDAITVQQEKVAYGYTQEQADEKLAAFQAEVKQSGNTLRIEVQPAAERQNDPLSKIDFTITVPTDTSVILKTAQGNLSVSGITGAAELETTFGEVSVIQFMGGPLQARTHSGGIETRDVDTGDEAVTLTADMGDARLEEVTCGELTIRSDSGALTLASVEASNSVDLETQFGEVTFESGAAGALTANSRGGGSITLSDLEVAGALIAHTSFGALDIRRVDAASYDLQGGTGILLEGASGKITVKTDFGAVDVRNASQATLDIQSQNGPLQFEGSLGTGPHTLRSDFGAVTLRLPAASAFDIDLQTEFGKISSDFEVTLQGNLEANHWVGRVGRGGDLLTVSTKNGNITLEAGE